MDREKYFFSGTLDVVCYLFVYFLMPFGAALYAADTGKVDFLWSVFSLAIGVVYDCYGRYTGGKACEANKYAIGVGASQAVLALAVVFALMRLATDQELKMGNVLLFPLIAVPAINAAWQYYKFRVDDSSAKMAINV